MKICYLANAKSVHTQRWARHFSRKYEVTVVSFEPASIEGVDVISLPLQGPLRRLGVFRSVIGVRKLLHTAIRPDIVHAHYITSYGLAGALSGLHPFVATAWGSDALIAPEKSTLLRWMVRFSLGRADLVTSMADHMTELMIRRRYVHPDQVVTLPFGVDTGVFHLRRRIPSDVRVPILIVSTRRLDEGLDVDVLLRAIPGILKAAGKDVRFIVAGGGPLRSRYEGLAAYLGIESSVRFEGAISQEEMALLLGQADLFISTSPSDGNNISLNEAMACGVFPIVTDIAANRAWITHGENGLLFPCRDANALADRVIEALGRPEWRQAVVPVNWEIVRTRASWDESMAVMEGHYLRLLGRSR